MTTRQKTQVPLMPRTPKRNGPDHPKYINWFPYYAGYSSSFVFDVLQSINLKAGDTVFDPWNGSGTTTTTAYRMGANVIGCDINPVMVVAAKSTLLDLETVPGIRSLTEKIIHAAIQSRAGTEADPLTEWFYPQSALALRQLHVSIWNLLVDTAGGPTCTAESISELSTAAAFFLTALFRTTRGFIAPFVGSNPTWVRSPKSDQRRIRPSRDRVFESFRRHVEEMTNRLSAAMSNGLSQPPRYVDPRIAVCSSRESKVADAVADVVVTSPPYLTRIDYAVATKPELACLGLSLDADFNSLRRTMMGAPSVRLERVSASSYGTECDEFLQQVRSHPSKGSENYYYKLFVQYFSDLSTSMKELARALKPAGTCVLVVQDSYYKELHIDLARYTADIAQQCGLILKDQHNFEWGRNMVRVNSRSRRYRPTTDAIESVLWLRK
jgi:DNA modification methylase